MKVIYYNVSGESMEILQFLLSNFFGSKGEEFMPLIELLQKNNFDIKRCLSELKPEMLAPIVRTFMSMADKNNGPTVNVGQNNGITPIAKIADKEIVYTLNKYFYD